MLDLAAAGGRHVVPPAAAACGSLAATPATRLSACRWPAGRDPGRAARDQARGV